MPQGLQDTIAGRVQLIVLAVPSVAAAVAGAGRGGEESESRAGNNS